MAQSFWCRKKIKDAPIRLVDGDRSAKYPKRSEFVPEGVVFLNAESIKDGHINLEAVNFIAENKYSSVSKGRIQANDIVMTTRGNGTGDVAFVGKKISAGLINAQMLILRADDIEVDAQFLYYHLCSPSFAASIQGYRSGSAQPQLPMFALREMEIEYPDPSVQRGIASILSAYDDLIENNIQRIKILERMAQMLYREWFVNFRFPGHDKVRMVESELGLIPERWSVAKLGDVLTLEYGKALKEADRLGGFVLVYGSSGIVGNHNQKLVSGPGIIVGRKGNVGSVFYCHSDIWVIDTAYYVRSDQSLYFLYFNLLTQNFLNNDAAVPGLNRNQAYSLPVIVPDRNTLAEFDRIVAPMFALTRCLEAQNTNLRTTRDLLLPKLISGEIPVEAAELVEQTA